MLTGNTGSVMERPEIYELLEVVNGKQSATHRLQMMTDLLLERLFEIQVVEAMEQPEVVHGNR